MKIVCPKCESTKEIVGIEVQGIYDGVLFWECQICAHRFHRFPLGDRLRERAEEFVNKPKEET